MNLATRYGQLFWTKHGVSGLHPLSRSAHGHCSPNATSTRDTSKVRSRRADRMFPPVANLKKPTLTSRDLALVQTNSYTSLSVLVQRQRPSMGGEGSKKPPAARLRDPACGQNKIRHRRALYRAGQSEGAANATINRELSLLHRAFTLAKEAGRVTVVPTLPKKLKENNVRKGFLERDQFVAVRSAPPPDVK